MKEENYENNDLMVDVHRMRLITQNKMKGNAIYSTLSFRSGNLSANTTKYPKFR